MNTKDPNDQSRLQDQADETSAVRPTMGDGFSPAGMKSEPTNNGNVSQFDGLGSTLTSEIEKLKADLDKARKDHLYLLAEFENYKKNVIKERSDLRKYGSERLIIELLSVLDIFDTATKTMPTPENLDSFVKGMELTASELRATLSRFGVEEIPAEGKPFDPMIHEAISSEETDSVPPGHVSRVFRKPFKLHDRVVRPGQVVVAASTASS